MKLRVLITVFIVSGIFSGCSQLPKEPTITPSATATVKAVATLTPSVVPSVTPTFIPAHLSVLDEEINAINIWLWHGLRDNAKIELDQLISDFNTTNVYGIQVESKAILSDTQINATIAGLKNTDLMPNIILADSEWFPTWADGIMKILPLSDYVNHPTWGISPELSILAKKNVFPLWQKPAILFYNQTWAMELGFSEYPQTLADFEAQACAAARQLNEDNIKENNGTGGWIVDSSADTVLSWLNSFSTFGGDFSSYPSASDADTFNAAANWIRSLYDQGCAWVSRNPEPYSYFAKRYALFYSGLPDDISIQERISQNDPDSFYDTWELIPYPSDEHTALFTSHKGIAITVSSAAEQYASWILLKWLISEADLSALRNFAYGFPLSAPKVRSDNQHFAQVEHFIDLTDSLKLPEDWVSVSQVLRDGFSSVFAPGATVSNIAEIWMQITETIAEIRNIP